MSERFRIALAVAVLLPLLLAGQTKATTISGVEFSNWTMMGVVTIVDQGSMDEGDTRIVVALENASCSFMVADVDAAWMNCSWVWDFGNGAMGIGMDPDHVYATPGTYVVVLSIVDANESMVFTNSISVVVEAAMVGVDAVEPPPTVSYLLIVVVFLVVVVVIGVGFVVMNQVQQKNAGGSGSVETAEDGNVHEHIDSVLTSREISSDGDLGEMRQRIDQLGKK